jgi:hypothetical protein
MNIKYCGALCAVMAALTLNVGSSVCVSAEEISVEATAFVGEGTQESPYQLSTADDLFRFAEQVNNGNQSICAELTADIDLANKEWTPIGTVDKVYKGTFNGNGHTVMGLNITKSSINLGFFGKVSGAYISNFTIKGNIYITEAISGSTNYKGSTRWLGGAVGYITDGTTVSEINSYVDISNTSDVELKHVGGVVGSIQVDGTNVVTKCAYYGKINVCNTWDCIGGVVGYTNIGGNVSYCANLGSVTATKTSNSGGEYIGGILGYSNNSTATVKNCYNYGAVSDDNSNAKCGAIVGWIKNYSSSRYNNNYYLVGSSKCAYYNSNSKAIEENYKTEEQFKSGEVCYLLNNCEFKGDVAWYQTIGSDSVPVFSGKRVYNDTEDGSYCNVDTLSAVGGDIYVSIAGKLVDADNSVTAVDITAIEGLKNVSSNIFSNCTANKVIAYVYKNNDYGMDTNSKVTEKFVVTDNSVALNINNSENAEYYFTLVVDNAVYGGSKVSTDFLDEVDVIINEVDYEKITEAYEEDNKLKFDVGYTIPNVENTVRGQVIVNEWNDGRTEKSTDTLYYVTKAYAIGTDGAIKEVE